MHPHTLFDATSGARRESPRRRGFSLLEMVLSLTVLAIAFGAVGSVFVLAAKVMPHPDSAEAAGVRQSAALSRLVEDLETARFITEHSANAVTMVFPDRTGDGQPDRYRYAWGGTAGDPLTLTINGSAPVTIAEDVQSFSLAFDTEDTTVSVPSTQGESAEEVLYSMTSAPSVTTRQIWEGISIGQYIEPVLPAGATSFRVTRIRLRGRQQDGAGGELYVRINGVSGTTPDTSIVHAEEVLSESDLPYSMDWVDVPIDGMSPLAAGNNIALTISLKRNDPAGTFEHQMSGSGPGGMLLQYYPGGPWSNSAANGLLVEAYGVFSTSSPAVSLTRTIYTGATVALQVGAATAQTTSVRLYCEPGQDAAVWWSSFDASPLGTDINGDGVDWDAWDGGAPGAFQNGRWNVDGTFYSQAPNNFDQPVLIEATMGADAAGRSGAQLQINADQGGGQAVILLLAVGQDAAGEHYVQMYEVATASTLHFEVTELGSNLLRIQMLIAPGDNTAGLIVNGQPIGTFVYTPASDGWNDGVVYLSESDGGVFDEVRVHVGGTAVVTQSGGGGSGGSGTGSGGGAGASAGLDAGTEASLESLTESNKPSWAWW